ncbi:unnamed protein product [Bursaphelenchus okinawaensis]|uniref:RRP15-like protein n=1 Tax=Bursaphelenchus okinawaensis TaxID=465554 RepID=A0A811L953_9BILA|nr:unnamed protein product [Bursaphelenchus okinawaensis]CAG9120056.1 unnamed protein product [Bursaphelenchus okinawaensis]
MSLEVEEEKTVDINESYDSDEEDNNVVKTKKLTKRKAKTDDWAKLGHKKPNYGEERERERQLTAIATKGVTQLFNAVSERQKIIDQKLEEMENSKSRTKRHELLSELKSNDFHSQLYKKAAPEVKEDEVKDELKDEPAEDTEVDEDDIIPI